MATKGSSTSRGAKGRRLWYLMLAAMAIITAIIVRRYAECRASDKIMCGWYCVDWA